MKKSVHFIDFDGCFYPYLKDGTKITEEQRKAHIEKLIEKILENSKDAVEIQIVSGSNRQDWHIDFLNSHIQSDTPSPPSLLAFEEFAAELQKRTTVPVRFVPIVTGDFKTGKIGLTKRIMKEMVDQETRLYESEFNEQTQTYSLSSSAFERYEAFLKRHNFSKQQTGGIWDQTKFTLLYFLTHFIAAEEEQEDVFYDINFYDDNLRGPEQEDGILLQLKRYFSESVNTREFGEDSFFLCSETESLLVPTNAQLTFHHLTAEIFESIFVAKGAGVIDRQWPQDLALISQRAEQISFYEKDADAYHRKLVLRQFRQQSTSIARNINCLLSHFEVRESETDSTYIASKRHLVEGNILRYLHSEITEEDLLIDVVGSVMEFLLPPEITGFIQAQTEKLNQKIEVLKNAVQSEENKSRAALYENLIAKITAIAIDCCCRPELNGRMLLDLCDQIIKAIEVADQEVCLNLSEFPTVLVSQRANHLLSHLNAMESSLESSLERDSLTAKKIAVEKKVFDYCYRRLTVEDGFLVEAGRYVLESVFPPEIMSLFKKMMQKITELENQRDSEQKKSRPNSLFIEETNKKITLFGEVIDRMTAVTLDYCYQPLSSLSGQDLVEKLATTIEEEFLKKIEKMAILDNRRVASMAESLVKFAVTLSPVAIPTASRQFLMDYVADLRRLSVRQLPMMFASISVTRTLHLSR